MRNRFRTAVVVLIIAIVAAFSATPALAGWGWEDCPPASVKVEGGTPPHMSANAIERLMELSPGDRANEHARYNPGNK